MSRGRAVVTGMGVVCGGAVGVDAFFRLLLSGASAVRPVPALQSVGLCAGPMAFVTAGPDGADDAAGASIFSEPDRASRFALQAAREALASARLPALWPERLAAVLGTTLGNKGRWLQAVRGTAAPDPSRAHDFTCAGPARAVAKEAKAGLVQVLSTACASGNAALGAALSLLREGTCDAVLCGGVDALCDFVIAGFLALRAHDQAPCRPFDRDRAGLNLGEGAGFLVLETEDSARLRGARPRAYLDGCGLSSDANHMTGPDRDGVGLARAMIAALSDADCAPGAVDFVSLHGTATRYNDLMEGKGLHRVLGPRAAMVPTNSIKGAVGHTLGASGILKAIMAVLALEQQIVPPTAGHEVLDPEISLTVVSGAPRLMALSTVLSTSSGFGGMNAAVLLRRGES